MRRLVPLVRLPNTKCRPTPNDRLTIEEAARQFGVAVELLDPSAQPHSTDALPLSGGPDGWMVRRRWMDKWLAKRMNKDTKPTHVPNVYAVTFDVWKKNVCTERNVRLDVEAYSFVNAVHRLLTEIAQRAEGHVEIRELKLSRRNNVP